MPAPPAPDDRACVSLLVEATGAVLQAAKYDDRGHIAELSLSGVRVPLLPPEIGQLTTLLELTIREGELAELPPEISRLTALQTLQLEKNQLNQLPRDVGQLKALQTLWLGDNRLTALPPELGQLRNLSSVSLTRNQVRELPAELWQLTNLQTLALGGNRLTSLGAGIGRLAQLEELYLWGNQLPDLPSQLWELAKLRALNLATNQLNQLPGDVRQLTALETLRLGENGLTTLPPELGQLSNLSELDLSRNQVRELPAELWQLSNLRILGLGGNQLTSVGAGIGRLAQLEELYLWGNQLPDLPSQLWGLTKLRVLALGRNRLNQLPGELGRLTALQTLRLEDNQLRALPPELGQLENLGELNLTRNQVRELPAGLWQLTSLRVLALGRNRLTSVEAGIGRLAQLEELYLWGNQLADLPSQLWGLTKLRELDLGSNQLNQLPREVGQLTALQGLHLKSNQVRELPAELWQLSNLRILGLGGNQLTSIGDGVGRLAQLEELYLWGNQLADLPSQLWGLTKLRLLHLAGNRLEKLPAGVGRLMNLETLNLSDTDLQEIPRQIGQAQKLTSLDLANNRLTHLPHELGQLPLLQSVRLDGNRTLLSPPPEVVARGTDNVLVFLRELSKDRLTRSQAKLLVVGEAGTGKSSLLRVLRDEPFVPGLSTTHGVEVGQLMVGRGSRYTTAIILHTWDFGGQQIYHATHQFFFTRRSLYLVVWNARLGAEQGRLSYWLGTIQILAPDARVVLVATHIDERQPDLNYPQLKENYPQLVGHLSVSNRDRTGVAELRSVLAEQASTLPLIGQPWPRRWAAAEDALAASTAHYLSADRYTQICSENHVEEEVAKGTLADYFHDLGRILYFREDDVLSSLVVLKPNWVTKAISRILTDDATRAAGGILRHADLLRIWGRSADGETYERHLHPVFLRLMERFDLSYQIEAPVPGDHSNQSLIPQLLPHEPPANVPAWPRVPSGDDALVQMVYKLEFVPSGIMSWFIVRTQRYSRGLHWRDGTVLAYKGHEARVELNPARRELRLAAWGPQPQNFFSILKDTLDFILDRFEGLGVRREVPCICHWQRDPSAPCSRFYQYEDLVRRMTTARHEVECEESFSRVSVPTLLYGIHQSTHEQVMQDIKSSQELIRRQLVELERLKSIEQKLGEQSELIARGFTRQWNLEMRKLEAECPNTFSLVPAGGSRLDPQNWIGQEYYLYLFCQYPSGPHKVGEAYPLRKPREWWSTVSPWLNHLVKFLQFAVPMGKAVGAVYDAATVEQMKSSIDLMEQITKSLPELPTLSGAKRVLGQVDAGGDQQAVGPALRALYSFLKEADPAATYRGLFKTPTSDGNILWLCDVHREPYLAKPLPVD